MAEQHAFRLLSTIIFVETDLQTVQSTICSDGEVLEAVICAYRYTSSRPVDNLHLVVDSSSFAAPAHSQIWLRTGQLSEYLNLHICANVCADLGKEAPNAQGTSRFYHTSILYISLESQLMISLIIWMSGTPSTLSHVMIRLLPMVMWL